MYAFNRQLATFIQIQHIQIVCARVCICCGWIYQACARTNFVGIFKSLKDTNIYLCKIIFVEELNSVFGGLFI